MVVRLYLYTMGLSLSCVSSCAAQSSATCSMFTTLCQPQFDYNLFSCVMCKISECSLSVIYINRTVLTQLIDTALLRFDTCISMILLCNVRYEALSLPISLYADS